ncbi:MAG: hypothetical protein WCD79_02160 [Chthoniobacteraceae bacterium]
MLQNSIKAVRGLGLILAVAYLVFAAWGIHSIISQTTDYLPSSWSVSPGRVAFQMFWPVVAMGVLLLLPWRHIRSEWIWWPVFALLAFVISVHIGSLYISSRPGLGYFLLPSENMWLKVIYTAAIIFQPIVIILMRVCAIRDERLRSGMVGK